MKFTGLFLGLVSGFAAMLGLMWVSYKLAKHRRILEARRTPFNRR